MLERVVAGVQHLGCRRRATDEALEAWCVERGLAPPDKVAVAQRVADRATDGPVHSVAREGLLGSLLSAARSVLQIAPEG